MSDIHTDMSALNFRPAPTSMTNLHRKPHPIDIQPLQRCDSCGSVGTEGQLLSPTLQQSLPLNEMTLNNLTDAAKLQVRWDRSMCAEIELPEGYVDVAVLLIHWRENDWKAETRREIEELNCIFEDSFGYTVEILELHGDCSCSLSPRCRCSPQDRLDRQVLRFFKKHNGPDNLAIIYYTGHGSYNEISRQLQLDGMAEKDGTPKPPQVIWNCTEGKFVRIAECDILTIMDACFAGGVSAIVEGDYGRNYEYLGASDWDTITASPGEKSFTRALIHSLKLLVEENNGESFTTAILQRKIEQQNYRTHKPGVLLSRSRNDARRILLQPRKPTDDQSKRYFDDSKIHAHLNLRIELKQSELSDVDIENLAKLVSRAVRESSVSTRRVDLLSLTRRGRPTWQEAAKRALAMRNSIRAMGSKQWLESVAEEKLERAPIHKPGVYAIFGWISPRLNLHQFTIPLPRPWPGIIIVSLSALMIAKRSWMFPSLKSVVFAFLGRHNNGG